MKKLFAAALLIVSTAPVSAEVLHYTLHDVTFDDGGTATGSFDFDNVLHQVDNVAIVTSAGSVLSGSDYHLAASFYGDGFATYSTYDATQVTLQLLIAGGANLGSASTQYLRTTPQTGLNYLYGEVDSFVTGSQRLFTGGYISTDAVDDPTTGGPRDVPEPAMLGLFGLGAIGLGLSRRRKA